jgi:hypothetical protein
MLFVLSHIAGQLNKTNLINESAITEQDILRRLWQNLSYLMALLAILLLVGPPVCVDLQFSRWTISCESVILSGRFSE